MNKAVFLTGEEKLNLTPADMFDRIINVKLTCLNKSQNNAVEEFVIRSDYEIIYPDSSVPLDGTIYPARKGTYLIRRCAQKPSIKVVYNMVTSNTGTSIDLYVSNFFMLTKDGKHLRSFNESEYVITKIEIAMGYWGQFRVSKEVEGNVPTYDEMFQIEAKNGADKITIVEVDYVTTDKLPPDSTLHVHGFVGEIYSAPLGVSQIVDIEGIKKNITVSSDSDFKKIFFEAITRRYLNRGRLSSKDNDKISSTAPYTEIQVSEFQTFGVPIDVDKTTAKMSESDAKKYGVQVYLSPVALGLEIEKAIDGNGNEVTKNVYFEDGYTIGQTIARIVSFVNTKLTYTFNANGDVIVFSPNEMRNPAGLYKALAEQGMFDDSVFANKALYDNKLPAVYNINVDAVATIVCPFFTFLEPFQVVEFASRYALTSLVSYYASYAPTVYQFLVIKAICSFATVDDINEVQITAVSTKR